MRMRRPKWLIGRQFKQEERLRLRNEVGGILQQTLDEMDETEKRNRLTMLAWSALYGILIGGAVAYFTPCPGSASEPASNQRGDNDRNSGSSQVAPDHSSPVAQRGALNLVPQVVSVKLALGAGALPHEIGNSTTLVVLMNCTNSVSVPYQRSRNRKVVFSDLRGLEYA